MTNEFILVDIKNHIATVTLNRPDKRNALNRQCVIELLQTFERLEKNTDVRVMLLTANGDHFCAGADINWMLQVAEGPYKQNYEDAILLSDLLHHFHCFLKPTIILVHGATLGGGLGLLCAADIAIAGKNANFGFSEVNIGLTPSTISPYVLSAMGERAARYYFLTGERFDSTEALRLNLVHKVVDNEALSAVGLEIAKTLLLNGPEALSEVKKLIHYVSHEKISKELSLKTASHLAKIRSSLEAQEGFKAFKAKRRPTWSHE